MADNQQAQADICVLGLGYVGLPTASLLASAGFRVLGVDIDERVIDGLGGGSTRLREAGLATLVSAAVRSGNLVGAHQPAPADCFVICVATPLTGRKTADLSSVASATRSVLPELRPGNLVILESTAPVGTTRNLVGRILAESGLEPGRDFDLCYCPERVLPGNTLSELINNDRIIGGLTVHSALRARAIYERFCQGKIRLTDDRTAELCKLMENSYRDVNIALANVFARIAEDAQVSVSEAIALANLHPRVRILEPGPGVGGHCVPVDPWFLVEAYPDATALLRAARALNDGQAERILARLHAVGPLTAGDRLAILGAAYKADVDDPRDSPAFRLASLARGGGLSVSIHDPLVAPGAYEGFEVGSDLTVCLKNAAAAVLMTEHQQYRGLGPPVFLENMTGRLILDGRNRLNHGPLRAAGLTVVVLGEGKQEPAERRHLLDRRQDANSPIGEPRE